ncbi:MAG: SEL1-like repeat protein [Gammaproteobacteria bacterium]|nr:SEL1-like repeat protein [Gammaproteobacteria bacterium]
MSTPESWFQQGEALVTRHTYGTEEFRAGLVLLGKAAAAGVIEAQVALGHVHAQVHVLPDAFAEAVRWYRQAAEQAHPMAQDRLADLYMLGRGVPQDDTQAFQWYARTAEQYYAMAQCNLAYMHAAGIGTPLDDIAATTLYLQAAAQGEARAYFNLGLRYLKGRGAPANPVHACAWMSNAARLDYPTSKTELTCLETPLTAQERQQAATLAKHIQDNFGMLQRALGNTAGATASATLYRQVVEDNFQKLGVTAFSLTPHQRLEDGTTHALAAEPGLKSSIHNERPHIFSIADFVSKHECAHLMALASHDFQSAQQHTRELLSGEQTAFTGYAATFSTPYYDAVSRNLERRVATAFNLPVYHVEPLSVLRYRAGDRYAPHVDYFDAARLENNRRHGDHSGQRIASFLVYLSAPEEGGETHYLKINRKIRGEPRMALCHYNCVTGGETDPMTLHMGAPVIRGEKWLARTTLREKPLF